MSMNILHAAAVSCLCVAYESRRIFGLSSNEHIATDVAAFRMAMLLVASSCCT